LGKWQNRYGFQIVGLMNRYCRTEQVLIAFH
jgi:hypothetical protein